MWIAFTLCAAILQTLRFVLQKRLSVTELSTAGATFARFLFAAPLASIAALVLVIATGTTVPLPSAEFFAWVLVGGVAQILATDLTMRLFQMRNFLVGVVFTKTETVQVALFSVWVLGETVATIAFLAMLLGLVGILILSRPPEAGARLFGRSAAFGLMAGGLFAVAAIGYRGATVALEPAPFLLRALLALAAATTVQTVIMAFWLRLREPGEIWRVTSGWRRTLPVGITGMLGSLGWFAAFSLQNAAYVRALGQIEIVFTLLASTLIFGERMRRREALGIALVTISVVMLTLEVGMHG
jgi:drug/metabolite transporter (DMT)-like permease